MYKVEFNSGAEMLNFLCAGKDLYNIETSQYMFLYNIDNAVAVYYLSDSEARRIAEQVDESEYWGSRLGTGGSVYNDPSTDDFDPDWHVSNLDYCNEYYNEGTWVLADKTFLDEEVSIYGN